jgi:hypothetical protein
MAYIKKADIVGEPNFTSRFDVHDKNPQMRYSWVLKNDEEQMNDAYVKGYVPATGKEKIMRNPFESAKDVEGSTKVRGTGTSERILMCCPKHLVKEREKERAARYVPAKKAAADDARKMMATGTGFTVESEASEETKQESIMEKQ